MKHTFSQMQPGGRNPAKQHGVKRRKLYRRRKWKVVGLPEPVVSERVLELLQRAFLIWLWRAYRSRDLPVEDVAAEIGTTRQGFTNLLKPNAEFFFRMFLRTCFLVRERETSITIVAEGWKIQLRWRSNEATAVAYPGAAEGLGGLSCQRRP
jgi:hypothetical protein